MGLIQSTKAPKHLTSPKSFPDEFGHRQDVHEVIAPVSARERASERERAREERRSVRERERGGGGGGGIERETERKRFRERCIARE